MASLSPNRGLVVFSGGSAANSLVDVFNSVRKSKDCSLSYIIPISDNGGSSSELIRFFGGPGIGDVRSESSKGSTLCYWNTLDLMPSRPPCPPDSHRAPIRRTFRHSQTLQPSPEQHLLKRGAVGVVRHRVWRLAHLVQHSVGEEGTHPILPQRHESGGPQACPSPNIHL